MSKIPLSDQILPTDYLLSALTNIKAGKPVSGDDLLLAIEQTLQQPLPEALRSVISRATVPESCWLRHADLCRRCLFLREDRKSPAHRQTDASDPFRKWRRNDRELFRPVGS
jgi:hypothetical protein